MQLSYPPPPTRAPAALPARPQPVRMSAPWPFYVQAPRRPCGDMEANARRVLEISARYFSAPMAELATAPTPVQPRGALKKQR